MGLGRMRAVASVGCVVGLGVAAGAARGRHEIDLACGQRAQGTRGVACSQVFFCAVVTIFCANAPCSIRSAASEAFGWTWVASGASSLSSRGVGSKVGCCTMQLSLRLRSTQVTSFSFRISGGADVHNMRGRDCAPLCAC